MITWDEGSRKSNHILTLVLGRTLHGVQSDQLITHCSTLRTAEDVLDLAALGCAKTATSFANGFGF